MKRAIISGLALLACAALLSKSVARADNEEQLLGDASRASRFKVVIRETLRELGLDISILSEEIIKRFTFPSDVEDASIFGIDLSHHNEDGCNCKINWTDVEAQKVTFAYLKATQGATGQDTRFSNNWNLLAQTSILRGAYHFLSPFSSAEEQVKNFLKTIGPLQPKDMPPVMDIEWTDAANPDNDGWKNMSSDEIVQFALKWLTAVEDATGRTPVIYTSRAWWKDRITDANLGKFQRYPIWLAQYVPDSTKGQEVPKNLPAAWTTWAIWQFTESGSFTQGLKAAVDVSVFKGSLEKFQQTFGVVLPPPTTSGNDNPKPDTPTDANVTPGGGITPGGSNTPTGPAMPTVGNMPSGPASPSSGTSPPQADPAKDANLATPSSSKPPTGANPPSSSLNTPTGSPANKPSNDGLLGAAPGSSSSPSSSSKPKANQDQGNVGLGGNAFIRME